MKLGSIRFYIGVCLSTLSSIFTHSAHGKSIQAKLETKFKKRETSLTSSGVSVNYRSAGAGQGPPPGSAKRYPWRNDIVTTTFWIGEKPTKNNPVPNHASSWDSQWAENYGGYDDPDNRNGYLPAGFIPKQNPFYVALPYNDKMMTGHKPEANDVIPWFDEVYDGPGKSVCKGRWIAIKYGDKICYAQWEDVGPFRTDHWEYVFGNERPKPNLNKGAGLDVSPAVRDYLGMDSTDVTSWRFVEFEEVPQGPWAKHGDNNTFVIERRNGGQKLASNR